MAERPYNQEFAERLKTLLIQKGMVNKKGMPKNRLFAKAISKRESVTLEWLRGRIPTDQKDWIKLCDFFGITADLLLLGRDEPHPSTIHINLNYDKELAKAIEKRRDFRRSEDKLIWLLLYKFIKSKVEIENKPAQFSP